MALRAMASVKRYGSDRGGNIGIIFALLATAVGGLMGGALDYGRAVDARGAMQAALDAVALAAAKKPEATTADVQRMADDFMALNADAATAMVQNLAVSVTPNDTGFTARATAELPTTLLSILGINTLDIAVTANVELAGGPTEIALVLDNTGSMSQEMAQLRDAAQEFVDIVTKNGTNTEAKVAIVPFVTSVNIGNEPAKLAWMDVEGNARHHGEMLEWRWLAKYNHCSWPSGGGGGGGNPEHAEEGQEEASLLGEGAKLASLLDYATARAGSVATGLWGASAAFADQAQAYTFRVVDGCYPANPTKINHFTLFDLIPNVQWKGCVEARPEPYDVDDTAPDTSRPDTLWVPYFWADHEDNYNDGNNRANKYLTDEPFIADTDLATNTWGRAYSVLKYNGRPADKDETPSDTRGPNRSCADPIQPLTNNHGQLTSAIAQMKHWNNGGTNTAQGLAWGWRVLSPTEPFTEGKPYGEIEKTIVLMTDGENQVLREDGPFGSHYSAYGYLNQRRMGNEGTSEAIDYVNGRLLQACANAKAQGITIYTVLFLAGFSADKTQKMLDLYSQCATSPPYVYHVRVAQDLTPAFRDIGMRVSKLHLSK